MSNKSINLNGESYLVDQRLASFEIFQKPSSNVDFFGTDKVSKRLFVQFKGGTGSYMYSNLPDKLLTWAENAESIGKFISGEVVNKFSSEKFEERLVKQTSNISEPNQVGRRINRFGQNGNVKTESYPLK